MFDVNGLSFGAADRGMPLPEPLRSRMEALFGVRFDDVRVHLGRQVRALGAMAFAHGSDLYFDPAVWDPHSADGWALIGHELTHVRQSLRGWALAPEGIGVRLLQDAALEAEADRMAHLARRAFDAGPLPALRREPARGPRRWDVVQAAMRLPRQSAAPAPRP
jgi:hypothetical protein